MLSPLRNRLALLLLVYAHGVAGSVIAEEPLVRLTFDGQALEGMPLAASEENIIFLARDGRLLEFPPGKAEEPAVLSGGFRSYSQAEMRGQLLREFGRGYDVSGVGHYLVVHPAGQKDQWAPRFEALYRSFVHYFAARGWQLEGPQFPLVAVIYRTQSDFQRQALKEGVEVGNSLLGYYSPVTNRILIYDVTAGGSGIDWTVNAETIVHEAAHQAAFNTGVHSRYGVAPRWVVEGLGTMFEARGVWQSQAYRNRGDRVNERLLAAHRQLVASGRRPAGSIADVVSSDRVFDNNSSLAYSESWALTFFLCETEPRKYFTYLAKTAATPPFHRPRGPERLKDFTDVFGTNLKMLDARMQRFLAGLK